MTEKELLKLKRSEMLEIMLAQSQEIDNLRKERDELKEKLADRRIRIEKAGSLAEASLQLTNIFVEAQKAADLYVENIKRSAARNKSVAEVHVNEKAAADRSTTMKSAADRLTAENRHNREGKDNG
jgi:hypothetical protein